MGGFRDNLPETNVRQIVRDIPTPVKETPAPTSVRNIVSKTNLIDQVGVVTQTPPLKADLGTASTYVQQNTREKLNNERMSF